jgi:predicted O-methyltransferase YrrM
MRKIKPKIVVETGVSFGITSSFILQAMEENGFGTLYSIDLLFELGLSVE